LFFSIELKITQVAVAEVAGKGKLRRGCRGAGGARRRRKLAAAGIRGAGGTTRRERLTAAAGISTRKGSGFVDFFVLSLTSI
jgi:hypothetical protein